jgi:predicted PurR-regulated permease PerM
VGTWAAGLLTGFVNSSLDLLLTFSMMYFFIFFMFKKHEVFESTLIKYMPYREKNSEHFAAEFKNMTYANIIGQGIIAFAQAAAMAIGFIIFGIPDPLFWSLICFFVSFLPVIGSAAVFVPAGLIELTSGNSFSGFGILGLVFGPLLISIFLLLIRLYEAAFINETSEKERVVKNEELKD